MERKTETAMTTPLSVRARVTLTIEMDGGSTWGADCGLEQIHNQAKEHVLDKLHNKHQSKDFVDFNIVGDPKVVAILVEKVK